jgi:hypothetical protein
MSNLSQTLPLISQKAITMKNKNGIHKVAFDGKHIIALTKTNTQDSIILSIDPHHLSLGEYIAQAINEKITKDKNSGHKNDTIASLKEAMDKNTSEELFNLPLPPPYQCENIYNFQKLLENSINNKSNLKPEQLTELLNFIENLRRAIEGVRAWGKAWKKLSKELLEQRGGMNDLINL